MNITFNKYESKPERPMKFQWLLMAFFLAAWLVLALVFFVPTIQAAVSVQP